MLESKYPKLEQTEQEDILFFLGTYGAPIGNLPASPNKELSFEEVVVKALVFSRQNPIVARAFPVFIVKNEQRFKNFQRLKELVIKEHQENTLGFFLDVTYELTGKEIYKELAGQLKKNPTVEDFFVIYKPSKYRERLLTRNTPVIAKRWFFRMNMNLDSFQSTFKKFVSQDVTTNSPETVTNRYEVSRR